MKKLQHKRWQAGEIATVITLGTLLILGITTFVSSMIINKTQQSTKTKAAEVKEDSTCSEEGAYTFNCMNNRGSCAEDAGEAEVYQCLSGKWKFQYPECQNACKPGVTPTKSKQCEGNAPFTVIDSCKETRCDESGSPKKLLCVETFCDANGVLQEKIGRVENPSSCEKPTATPPPDSSSDGGSGATPPVNPTRSGGATTGPTRPPTSPSPDNLQLCVSEFEGKTYRNAVGVTFCSEPEGPSDELKIRKYLFKCNPPDTSNKKTWVSKVDCTESNKVCDFKGDQTANCIDPDKPLVTTAPTNSPNGSITFKATGKITNAGNGSLSDLRAVISISVKEVEKYQITGNFIESAIAYDGSYVVIATIDRSELNRLENCAILVYHKNYPQRFFTYSDAFFCNATNTDFKKDFTINYNAPTGVTPSPQATNAPNTPVPPFSPTATPPPVNALIRLNVTIEKSCPNINGTVGLIIPDWNKPGEVITTATSTLSGNHIQDKPKFDTIYSMVEGADGSRIFRFEKKMLSVDPDLDITVQSWVWLDNNRDKFYRSEQGNWTKVKPSYINEINGFRIIPLATRITSC